MYTRTCYAHHVHYFSIRLEYGHHIKLISANTLYEAYEQVSWPLITNIHSHVCTQLCIYTGNKHRLLHLVGVLYDAP